MIPKKIKAGNLMPLRILTIQAVLMVFLQISCQTNDSININGQKLSRDILLNAKINIKDNHNKNQIIQLKNGEYSNPSESISLVINPKMAFGDINGDGKEDAVMFMSINTGGSGSWLHLAALVNHGEHLKHISSVEIEDRAQVLDVKINSGQISTVILKHAEDDGLCCPSKIEFTEYKVHKNKIIESQSPSDTFQKYNAAFASLSLGERQAWLVWREAFLDTLPLKTMGSEPEEWISVFMPERAKTAKFGVKTPFVYVLAVDAQNRMRDTISLMQYISGSKEEMVKQTMKSLEIAKRWQKCFNDMRQYAR